MSNKPYTRKEAQALNQGKGIVVDYTRGLRSQMKDGTFDAESNIEDIEFEDVTDQDQKQLKKPE